ncbi:MAG TPA: 6-bladed beta-propeller [Gemmatimonadales bacterium]
MRHLPCFTLAAISVVTLGCGVESRTPSVEWIRDTLPDGTVAARYGRLAEPQLPPFQTDLSIGVTEGDPNLIFGDVRGIEAGGDGTIYILDYQASEVRAFDANGRFLRRLTSKGAGPGELTEANGMVLIGDSALWIQDHGQGMMIAVDLNGEELTRVPMHVRSYGYMWNGTIDDRGRFWKPTTHSDEPRQYPPKEGLNEGHARVYLKSYDARAEITDSVFVGEDTYRSFVARNNQGGHTYRTIPYYPRIITIVDPAGGFWHTSGTAYRIARLDERGDTTLVIEVAAEPLPVTDQDRQRYVSDEVQSSPDDRRVAEQVAALMPAFKPAIAALVMDDTGRLWVRRTAAAGETPTYDVFKPNGDYDGSVTLAFAASEYLPLRIRRGRVYGLVRDTLDVPSVVRAAPLPAYLR